MENLRLQKKLSTELKAILLDLDEQDKYENKSCVGEEGW